ncbi:hypothetical protein OG216_09805 [Streptomycetaceae bacterium NBC_01309]
MTFSARKYARELIESAPAAFTFKQVAEGLPWWDLDIPGDDTADAVNAILAELAAAQVTVTFPTPAGCCPHCPHREDPR